MLINRILTAREGKKGEQENICMFVKNQIYKQPPQSQHAIHIIHILYT